MWSPNINIFIDPRWGRVNLTVTNTGKQDGETVVQLYINDKESSVPTTIKTLRKFKKVFLEKGASKKVKFEITPKDLSIFDHNGDSFVETGVFEVFIGENSNTTNKVLLTVK